MGHRKTRAAPTKPRRIHATDEEWAEVKNRAGTAALSVSAYMVTQALNATDPGFDPVRFRSVQLLTTIHVLLTEIANCAMQDLGDLDTAQVLAALQKTQEMPGVSCPEFLAQDPRWTGL